MSLNLEYLIQFGATAELIKFYGWPGVEVDVEVGEFDAVAYQGGRVVLANRIGTRVELAPFTTVEHGAVLAATSQVPIPHPAPSIEPRLDHALDIALMTDVDGQQRCCEFLWRDEAQLDVFTVELREKASLLRTSHARPWKWRSDGSGADPLTPSVRTTGLELRFSYYAG